MLALLPVPLSAWCTALPTLIVPSCPNNNTKMKLALSLALAGSAAAYTAPTMTFSLGKKKAAPAAVPKVS